MSDKPFDTDDELRALLRNADPARSLPPADPAALSQLLEVVMSTDLETRPEEGTRVTGTHGRNPLTWLVATAAAVVIAATGGFAISTLGTDALPSATDGVSDAPDPGAVDDPSAPIAGTTTELTGGAALGRCMAPNAEFIGQQEQAFAGTVTAIDGGSVTIETTDVYAGKVGETVVVTAPSPDLVSLIQATRFEVGSSYLVSATDGRVSVCGMTGKASGQLQTLYNEAFAR